VSSGAFCWAETKQRPRLRCFAQNPADDRSGEPAGREIPDKKHFVLLGGDEGNKLLRTKGNQCPHSREIFSSPAECRPDHQHIIQPFNTSFSSSFWAGSICTLQDQPREAGFPTPRPWGRCDRPQNMDMEFWNPCHRWIPWSFRLRARLRLCRGGFLRPPPGATRLRRKLRPQLPQSVSISRQDRNCPQSVTNPYARFSVRSSASVPLCPGDSAFRALLLAPPRIGRGKPLIARSVLKPVRGRAIRVASTDRGVGLLHFCKSPGP
jgi:hypothetical protein